MPPAEYTNLISNACRIAQPTPGAGSAPRIAALIAYFLHISRHADILSLIRRHHALFSLSVSRRRRLGMGEPRRIFPGAALLIYHSPDVGKIDEEAAILERTVQIAVYRRYTLRWKIFPNTTGPFASAPIHIHFSASVVGALRYRREAYSAPASRVSTVLYLQATSSI